MDEFRGERDDVDRKSSRQWMGEETIQLMRTRQETTRQDKTRQDRSQHGALGVALGLRPDLT